jgi:hypothetical protein
MTSCQVFLFGDLAIHFEDELRHILHVKGNESLHSFFDQVGFALREEFGNLPKSQQDLFPRFTTLVDLLSKLGETEGTPVLRFCLLSICEIGQFIRYETGSPRHSRRTKTHMNFQIFRGRIETISRCSQQLLLRAMHRFIRCSCYQFVPNTVRVDPCWCRGRSCGLPNRSSLTCSARRHSQVECRHPSILVGGDQCPGR